MINAVGRLSMIVGVNTGRRARVAAGRLRRPDSVLTRAAEAEARRRLTPALLNHFYRTCRETRSFGWGDQSAGVGAVAGEGVG